MDDDYLEFWRHSIDFAAYGTLLAFRTIDRWAALLMLPYLGWVSFATVLNIALWRLNPTA